MMLMTSVLSLGERGGVSLGERRGVSLMGRDQMGLVGQMVGRGRRRK